jgi:hypothetical protein
MSFTRRFHGNAVSRSDTVVNPCLKVIRLKDKDVQLYCVYMEMKWKEIKLRKIREEKGGVSLLEFQRVFCVF